MVEGGEGYKRHNDRTRGMSCPEGGGVANGMTRKSQYFNRLARDVSKIGGAVDPRVTEAGSVDPRTTGFHQSYPGKMGGPTSQGGRNG